MAAPSHPLGSKPWVIRPADLDEHVQLVLTDRTTLTEGKTFGVFSPHRWRLADLGARHAFLRAGFGWGHMPVAMVQDDLDSGKLVPLQLEAFQPYTPPIAMFAVYRKDTPPGPAGRWFLKRLKAGRDNDQQ
ncbi:MULTISPECIES: LysR substrate-binding domain-containing protein [Ralstonia]|uniref:LysR substrate-binding domain-containing protein n=1 Tax=Ralstonia TaxID=48736 RepID=UPI000B083B61|nr:MULTISPECIES: LysR substrate-binding domain-containing protein [Ralstonia]